MFKTLLIPFFILSVAGCSLYKSAGRKAYESANLSEFNFASSFCFSGSPENQFEWQKLSDTEKDSFEITSQGPQQWVVENSHSGAQCWLNP